jgi:hypothetical protein
MLPQIANCLSANWAFATNIGSDVNKEMPRRWTSALFFEGHRIAQGVGELVGQRS